MELLNLRPDHTPKKIKSTSSPETNMKPPPDKHAYHSPINRKPSKFTEFPSNSARTGVNCPSWKSPPLTRQNPSSSSDQLTPWTIGRKKINHPATRTLAPRPAPPPTSSALPRGGAAADGRGGDPRSNNAQGGVGFYLPRRRQRRQLTCSRRWRRRWDAKGRGEGNMFGLGNCEL